MNFLAHIYLSFNEPLIMVGNFIGDFVKGNQLLEYPAKIQTGIRLHREIDQFTDRHEIVLRSKRKLRPKYHHYAPVIVDVFYDHFLAINWEEFHDEPLVLFIERNYQIITENEQYLPTRAKKMFHYMKRDNWLLQYQDIGGIDQALAGMSRRTTFKSKMEEASLDLRKEFDAYQQEFLSFFPLLEAHSKKLLLSLS